MSVGAIFFRCADGFFVIVGRGPVDCAVPVLAVWRDYWVDFSLGCGSHFNISSAFSVLCRGVSPQRCFVWPCGIFRLRGRPGSGPNGVVRMCDSRHPCFYVRVLILCRPCHVLSFRDGSVIHVLHVTCVGLLGGYWWTALWFFLSLHCYDWSCILLRLI